MISGILYTSNTGTSERYAKMLSEKTGLPVYELTKSPLPSGSEIIYIGWLFASGIKGYKKASRKYDVKAVCGVGMGATGSQIEDVRKANQLSESMPLFTMQGGFDMKKLKGLDKFLMTMMIKFAGKGLAEKEDRTPDEDDMLDMMLHGGDRVSEEHMEELLAWYQEEGSK